MKEGKVVEQGSHDELLQWNSEYTDLIKSFGKRQEESISKEIPESLKKRNLSSALSISESIIDITTQADRESDDEGVTRVDGLKSEFNYRSYVDGERGWWRSAIVCVLSFLYSLPIAAAPLVFTYIAQVTPEYNSMQ